MKWPLITRRRHERELAELTADRERIRGERNQFAKDRNAFKATAKTAARQFTEAGIVIDCLERDLAAAQKQLAARGQHDTVPLADYEAQRKRADQLQARLDDACGLDDPGVQAGVNWQTRRADKPKPQVTS